ncbi:MAG: phosphatidate cytidylyltransferase [Microbacteriaceae bacterium]
MSDDPPDDPEPVTPHRGHPGHTEFRAQMRATRADFEHQVQMRRAQIDATNERITARTGRNLILAILIGVGLGLVTLFSLIVVKELFVLFAMVVSGFAAFEFSGALRASGRRVPRIPSTVAAVLLIPLAYYADAQGAWLAVLGAIIALSIWRLVEQFFDRFRTSPTALWRDLRSTALVQVYVPFLASFAVVLVHQDEGQWWALAFLVLVIAVDTGAYASGLSFGKHPMVPSISPKKTWEGFAGAALVSIIAGILLATLMLHQPWWFGPILGATILASATIGDLSESLIKRDLGIKDMSSWLPGHGGFLDRVDSILPSALAAYALFLIFA